MTPLAPINISDQFNSSVTVHMNVGQEVVVTTVDKVRLCLIDRRRTVFGLTLGRLLPAGC